MGHPSRYWIQVGVKSSGKLQIAAIPEAEAFFRQHFPEYVDYPVVVDRQIQQPLVTWYHSDDMGLRQQAERCLRCFISHELKAQGQKFTDQWGKNYDVTAQDLWPRILDGVNALRNRPRLRDNSSYRSLTTRTLQGFDPARGGLSQWTRQQFENSTEVKQFWTERGVKPLSSWLLLKQTTPEKLQKLLSTASTQYSLTPLEIQAQVELLSAFHAVYCAEVETTRAAGQRYPHPTSDQLARMAARLTVPSAAVLTIAAAPSEENLSDHLKDRLEQLANRLRIDPAKRWEYLSLDQPIGTGNASATDRLLDSAMTFIEPLPEPGSPDREINEKIEQYCDRYWQPAVENVVEAQISYWRKNRKGQQKADQVLRGLQLFYCQGLSQGAIAERLGLKNQIAVNRLLKLQVLREDISRTMVDYLTKHVLEEVAPKYVSKFGAEASPPPYIADLAQARCNPERLRQLKQQTSQFLTPRIEQLVNRAKKEAFNSRDRTMACQVSRTICTYVQTRNPDHD